MITIEFNVCTGEDSDGRATFEWQYLESFNDLADAVPALEAHRSGEGEFRIAGQFVILTQDGVSGRRPLDLHAGDWTVQSDPIPFDDANEGARAIYANYLKIGVDNPPTVITSTDDLRNYGIESIGPAKDEAMTNSKILEYGKGELTRLLTEIERQTLYCLKIAITPVPCPACHAMVNQIDASGKSLDDFDATGSSRHEFHCPNCRRRLVEIVPFITSGPKYQWRLAEPLPPVAKGGA